MRQDPKLSSEMQRRSRYDEALRAASAAFMVDETKRESARAAISLIDVPDDDPEYRAALAALPEMAGNWRALGIGTDYRPRQARDDVQRARARRLLSCFGKDRNAGAEACAKAAAFSGCAFRGREYDHDCPLALQVAGFAAVGANLAAGDVPGRCVETILAAVPNALEGQPRPLVHGDALTLVRAFVAGKPSTVTISGSVEVQFTGSEWFLALASDTGPGKSTAGAYAIACHGGLFLAAPDLGSIEVSEIPAQEAPLLVLDDVGTERSGATNYAGDRITALLERRYANNLPTIVTTNLTRRRQGDVGGFAERYGARLDDRLRDRAKFIRIAEASYRGRELTGASAPPPEAKPLPPRMTVARPSARVRHWADTDRDDE